MFWLIVVSAGPASTYGQVHYMAMHKTLPHALFSGQLGDFVEACDAKRQGELIYENFWLPLAAQLGGSLKASGRASGKIGSTSFPLLVDEVVNGNRLLIIGAPLPESTPHARYVGLWFSQSAPDVLVRYFASEMSVEEELLGDFLGEWTSEGAHHNFGDYCQAGGASPEGFAAAIFRTLKVSASESSEPQGAARSRAEIRKRVKAVSGQDLEATDMEVNWTSAPKKLGEAIFNHLRSLQQSGRKVLILNSEMASGLRVPVSTYFQFKILNKKTLLAEIQGDYSYWGVTVSSGEWHRFNTVGFDNPTSANGNFSMNFKDFRDDTALRNWLIRAVEPLQTVIRPEGAIGVRFF